MTQYDLDSLHASLDQFDKNIASIELVILRLKDAIRSEEEMLRFINDPNNPNLAINQHLIEVDSERIRKSISEHYIEIDNFDNEINAEKQRKMETEKLIMRIELEQEMAS